MIQKYHSLIYKVLDFFILAFLFINHYLGRLELGIRILLAAVIIISIGADSPITLIVAVFELLIFRELCIVYFFIISFSMNSFC